MKYYSYYGETIWEITKFYFYATLHILCANVGDTYCDVANTYLMTSTIIIIYSLFFISKQILQFNISLVIQIALSKPCIVSLITHKLDFSFYHKHIHHVSHKDISLYQY